MLVDYHVHTSFSDDSSYDMEQVVLDAIEKGLGEICFTDHVDYGIKIDREGLDDKTIQEYERITSTYPTKEHFQEWLEKRKGKVLNVDYDKYVNRIQYLKEKYKDQIVIKMGLEFGIQTHTISLYESLFSKYQFDFILLSIHQVDDKEFWAQEYQKGKTQDEYQLGYYNEMLNVIKQFKNYSVLAHMDMLIRYDQNGKYPFEKIKPIVTEILKQVIQDGKGIEVNSSCYYYGLDDLTPSKDILKLYKELGGTILSVGSDSHKPGQLGGHIQDVYDELKILGFDSICTYEKMKEKYRSIL